MPSLDYATATFDALLEGVQRVGTPEQKQRAEQIVRGYKNVAIGLPESVAAHRTALVSLLAAAEWQHAQSDEAKEAAQRMIQQNLGVLVQSDVTLPVPGASVPRQ